MSRTPSETPETVSGRGPESTYQEIAPIDLDFSALDGEPSPGVEASLATQSSRPAWMLPLLGGLLVVALAVIFLLPSVVQSPPAPVKAKTTTEIAQSSPSTEASPWQAAQLARERQAAQQALEPLLDKQFQLEELQVQHWAADDFEKIVALAEQGDQHYRQRKFAKATENFQQALSIADTLLNSVEQRTQDALRAGTQATESFDAEAARQAFELVSVIDPDNEALAASLARLTVLDDVQAAMLAAEILEQQGELSQARAQLEKAIALDSARAEVLAPRIAKLSDRIRDAHFARLMSEGYRNLDAGRRRAAINSFNAAAQLKPDESQPGIAIEQVRNQQALNAMASHFESGERSEATEQWSEAVTAYNAALKIDSNLGDASKRLAYAKQRLKMDSALETLSNDPLRLANAEIYQKALKIVAAGRNIPSPGPRLSRQLSTLEQYLRASRESRPVTIKSDGFTEVSLPRIARLGAIEQRQLNLKPGRYAAVGIRDGYRDVRKEFVVPLNASSVEVDIRCVEPI